MLKKLEYKILTTIILALSVSGCSAIRGIGKALTNSFKGFNIHFPTIHFP
jgi:hypothetical protein